MPLQNFFPTSLWFYTKVILNFLLQLINTCLYQRVMISWLLTYLAKGPTPDFNSGPGNNPNIGCILALQRLFKFNLNNSPSPSHSNLASDGVYICSGLLLVVSWWVPYLPKGFRPDFNNDLEGDSNNVPALAP